MMQTTRLIPSSKAPVHTNSLSEYSFELEIIPTSKEEGTEIRRQFRRIDRVVEQRVTHFLMGLGLAGTMTGPLLVVLGLMPRALFAGVFFVVGWGSIESNGMTTKLLFLARERRFMSRAHPLFLCRRQKIWLYLACQAVGVVACVAISQTIAAIGFPVLICALIPFRWLVMRRWFTSEELDAMDALTADNEVVLASLGGRPRDLGSMDKSESRR
jgi:hypothetical protein